MTSSVLVADPVGNRFVAELRRAPGRLDEKSFRALLDDVRAMAPHCVGREQLPREAVASLWSVCSMVGQWALHVNGVLRRTGIVSPRDLTLLAGWIDTLKYEIVLAWGAPSPLPPPEVPYVPTASRAAAMFASLRAEKARAARTHRATKRPMTPAEAAECILRHADLHGPGLLGHLAEGLVSESDFDELVEAFHAPDAALPRPVTIRRDVAIAAWEIVRLVRLQAVHTDGALRKAGYVSAEDAVRLSVLVDDLEHEGAISLFSA